MPQNRFFYQDQDYVDGSPDWEHIQVGGFNWYERLCWKEAIRAFLQGLLGTVMRPKVYFSEAECALKLDHNLGVYELCRSKVVQGTSIVPTEYISNPSLANHQYVSSPTRSAVEMGLTRFIYDDTLQYLTIQFEGQRLVMWRGSNGCCHQAVLDR